MRDFVNVKLGEVYPVNMHDVIYVKLDKVYPVNQQLNETISRKSFIFFETQ